MVLYRTMAIEPNLYRHPEALRDPTTRFTKLHEYYSFGIVLVEIAKWHSMRFILKRHYAYELKECGEEGMKKVREILLDPDSKENHMADVAFRMGDIYRNVVEVCLTGNFGVQGTGDELLEEFRRRVLEPLAKCCI
jgi:hypothetical protein